MADRFLLKQFAQNATNTGVFGSYQAGNPTYSNDPAEIQSLPAWFSGWLDATTNGTFLPRLEEMQGLQKVLCQAIIENYREGVPVWIAGESYYKNSVVSYEGTDGFALYYNLTGSYTNSTPDVDTTNWSNLASLFVTKEYLDNNFLGINRVTNSVLSDQDNSSFSSLSNVAFVNQGATVTNNVASGFSRYGTVLLSKSMLTSTNWSFVFSFTTPDVTTKQSLVAMPTLVSGLGIQNGHLFFGLNTGSLVEGTFPLTANASYAVRMKFNGSQYTVEIASETGIYNTDITVANSQQPFAGKTISLGNGGADYADNYFRGSIQLGSMTIKDGETVYWNVSTLSNINLIHFDGVYSVIAPNGRGADNNLNNIPYTITLNNYLNYSLVNGTKTILLKQDGEIMARTQYIESSTIPTTANTLDVWFNPDTNIMYEFSSQQPNFTNQNVPVNNGIATSFTATNYININTLISPLNKITLSLNTSGNVTTRQDYYSWGNSSLYIQNGNAYYDTQVTGYEVGINTGTSTEPEWTEIGYVPVNGNGILEAGTEVYSDVKCSEKLTDASGTDYGYTGSSAFEVVSCQLPITANQVYFVDCGYIGEKYTLMIGTAVDEVSSMVQTPDANLIHINGLTPLTGSTNPILGTVNLANIDLVTWQWNGVSHVATDWNRIVAGKLGTVTDNGTQITSLNMDKPLQLAKQTDLAQFKSEADRRITNITNKVTNCITEIPQDIKLELNNGTLTLKAESKVYSPNGKDSNGNNIFKEINLTSDFVISTGFDNETVALFYNGHRRMALNRIFSGETAPSNPENDNVWYDTSTNKIKTYNTNQAAWIEQTDCSLPIGIATANATGTGYVSIDQVFNGFGYIGSTVFALPGVKALIPNGRNADGTCKNIEVTNDSVKINTAPSHHTFNNYGWIINKYFNIFPYDLTMYYYNSNENFNYEKYNNAISLSTIIAYGSVSSGKITSFTPKTAFQAVDYNDFSAYKKENDSRIINITNNIETIENNKTGFPDYARKVNLSLGANTDYVIPYDCEFSCYTSGSPALVVYTNGELWSNIDTSSGIVSTTKGIIKKGVVVRLSNSTAGNVVVWICPLFE